MTEAETKPETKPEAKSVGRDAMGIALFGLAIFAAISVVMSLLKPVENPGGTTAVVHLLVGLIGAAPGLLLAAGLAWTSRSRRLPALWWRTCL